MQVGKVLYSTVGPKYLLVQYMYYVTRLLLASLLSLLLTPRNSTRTQYFSRFFIGVRVGTITFTEYCTLPTPNSQDESRASVERHQAIKQSSVNEKSYL